MTNKTQKNLLPDCEVPADEVQDREAITYTISAMFKGIANTAPYGKHFLVMPKDFRVNDGFIMERVLNVEYDDTIERDPYDDMIEELVNKVIETGKAPVHLISLKEYSYPEIRTWVLGSDASIWYPDEKWSQWLRRQKFAKDLIVAEAWQIAFERYAE